MNLVMPMKVRVLIITKLESLWWDNNQMGKSLEKDLMWFLLPHQASKNQKYYHNHNSYVTKEINHNTNNNNSNNKLLNNNNSNNNHKARETGLTNNSMDLNINNKHLNSHYLLKSQHGWVPLNGLKSNKKEMRYY